jgi:hypothetical protein
MPLALLVTVANVAEITVGLKVVDQVWVPRLYVTFLIIACFIGTLSRLRKQISL